MEEVKPQSEREIVIQHFVGRGLGFEHPSHKPLDLVVYLVKNRNVFVEQQTYIEKLTKAGVDSNMAKELFESVKKAVQAAAK